MLLLYDEHFSCISLEVVQLALKENAIILKFPTHVLLNIPCFRPFNKKWEKMINDHVTKYGTKNHIDKSKSEYYEEDVNKQEFEDEQLPYNKSDEEFSSEDDVLHEEKDEEIFTCPR